MMFNNDTPDTTMDEDLAALGMQPLTEARQEVRYLAEGDDGDADDKPAFLKKKDDDGDDDDDDDDDDDRNDVEVGQDEDEDYDDGVMTEEMIGDLRHGVFTLANDFGVEEDDFADFVEFISEETDTEFDALFEDSLFLAEDEIDSDEEFDGESDPKMEAAVTVIAMFEAAVSMLDEDDEDDAPTYDDLIGVIEAHSYMTDALLDEGMRSRAKKALRFARRKLKRMKRMGKGLKSTVKAARKGLVKVGGKFVKAGARAAQGFRKMMGKAGTAIMKRMYRKRMKAAKGRSAQDVKAKAKGMKMGADVEFDGNYAIAELDDHLHDIRETLSEAEVVELVESASSELLDGLKAIHDASTGYYEAIAEEISEDDEADEDDGRIAMGRHLESIASDAYRVAEMVSEGDAQLEDAADDLQALASDLDDALEAMKGIE